MTNHNTDNKPMYNSTYSFIAKVNGKIMEFVSENEYEEYVQDDKPIEIIKRYFVDRNPIPFRMKVVFYKRKSDNLYFVYRASQYFRNKPNTEVYTFESYWEAFSKYKQLGGK
jgi:hypothetical protein